MPVVQYHLNNGSKVGPKGFPAPKTATVRHWYKAAKKVLQELPFWDPSFEQRADIDVNSITFKLSEGTVFIARKRDLR